jgi:haloalkane dehalogenase
MPLRRLPVVRREPAARLEHVNVLGRRISYSQAGLGDPIVFVQGSFATSYLWRRVVPHLAGRARCIAVDLIGTGASERLVPSGDTSYRLTDQRLYFDGLMEVLGIEAGVTLVLHGSASMVGFDWAMRHAGGVKGICHMESIVRPLSWDELPEDVAELFRLARSEDGEEFVLRTDRYLDAALRREVLEPLSRPAILEYRKGLDGEPEMRRALLTGIRELPIDGTPSYPSYVARMYGGWLRGSTIPKLLVQGDPGYLLAGALLESARDLPNQTVVTVPGSHLLPEQSPDGIGRFLAHWYGSLQD